MPNVWQIVPKEYIRYLDAPLTEAAEELQAHSGGMLVTSGPAMKRALWKSAICATRTK